MRFAGSEPRDYVTRQYNTAMQEQLPAHGIEFVVFERITVEGEPISAKKVRQLLDERRYDELLRYVPETTEKYLRDMEEGRNFEYEF
jgi:[citrate (pro-3S)-lyase] ligase